MTTEEYMDEYYRGRQQHAARFAEAAKDLPAPDLELVHALIHSMVGVGLDSYVPKVWWDVYKKTESDFVTKEASWP
jgi:hypothetical protein